MTNSEIARTVAAIIEGPNDIEMAMREWLPTDDSGNVLPLELVKMLTFAVQLIRSYRAAFPDANVQVQTTD
jgi:hypothetical protein